MAKANVSAHLMFHGYRQFVSGDNKRPPEELIVECQGSSIGTYSAQWIQEFYSSCCGTSLTIFTLTGSYTVGISPETWLDKSKATRSRLPKPPLRILFPTLKTVRSSALGEAGGGTMFCRKTQWGGANFPKDLFHDSNSKRGKVLMHTKVSFIHSPAETDLAIDDPGSLDNKVAR